MFTWTIMSNDARPQRLRALYATLAILVTCITTSPRRVLVGVVIAVLEVKSVLWNTSPSGLISVTEKAWNKNYT